MIASIGHFASPFANLVTALDGQFVAVFIERRLRYDEFRVSRCRLAASRLYAIFRIASFAPDVSSDVSTSWRSTRAKYPRPECGDASPIIVENRLCAAIDQRAPVIGSSWLRDHRCLCFSNNKTTFVGAGYDRGKIYCLRESVTLSYCNCEFCNRFIFFFLLLSFAQFWWLLCNA